MCAEWSTSIVNYVKHSLNDSMTSLGIVLTEDIATSYGCCRYEGEYGLRQLEDSRTGRESRKLNMANRVN